MNRYYNPVRTLEGPGSTNQLTEQSRIFLSSEAGGRFRNPNRVL